LGRADFTPATIAHSQFRNPRGARFTSREPLHNHANGECNHGNGCVAAPRRSRP
jgi:hypothetical protein